MFENDDSRIIFFDVYEKSRNHEKLSAVENRISKVIEMHPMYFGALSDRDQYENYDVKPGDPDPLSHLALHATVVGMVSENEPEGLRPLYDRLVNQLRDKHEVQHRLMYALFDWMIEAAGKGHQALDNDGLMKIFEKEFEKDLS